MDKKINKKKKLFLIDGYAFIFRAFFVAPNLTTPDGVPIGAIQGFVQMLLRIINKQNIENIGVVLDKGSSKNTHRHKIYPEYKANRPPLPKELMVQFGIMREALNAFGIKYLEHNGFEADDIIASYAEDSKKQEYELIIVSSDKDLFQLIDQEHNISMYDPIKDVNVNKDYVFQKLGVMPEQVADYLALMGDASDNIPGAKGIGPKTAAVLLQKYGDMDNLYKHINEVQTSRVQSILKRDKEDIFMSRTLVELKYDLPLLYNFNELLWDGIEHHINNLQRFFEKYSLKTLTSRYLNLNVIIGNQISNSSYKKEYQNNHVENNDAANIKTAGLKEIIWSDNNQLNPSKLEEICQYIRYNDYIYINIETKKGINEKENNELVKISILCNDTIFHFVNIHEELLNQNSSLYNCIKQIFTTSFIKKITTNYKTMSKIFKAYNINTFQADDIIIMAYALGSGKYNGKYNIDNIFNEYLGNSGNDNNILILYKEIYPILLTKLRTQQQISLYYTVDKLLADVLAKMEYAGIYIDVNFLQNLSKEYEIKMSKIAKEIYVNAGSEFNIASPKQLSKVLFEDLKLPSSKKNKKNNQYSTNSSALEELSMHGHIIADNIIIWRRLFKIVTTYISGLLNNLNHDTKCIHTNFNTVITNTGRLSSTSPNLQSIPIRTEEGEKIRDAFVARDGYSIISADYSQIEIRLLAHLANIAQLKEALINGVDIHTLTASQVFNIPINDVDYSWRYKAKAINFGIIYGISPFGLARNLGISTYDAGKYIERYFDQYKGIKEYMVKIISEAKNNGYVKTIFNRRCFIQDINHSNGYIRKVAERSAINAPIQGSAADIIRKAMVMLPAEIANYLKLQIHDELLLEVPKNKVEEVVKIVRGVMESAAHLTVPLKVDIGYGESWGKLHTSKK